MTIEEREQLKASQLAQRQTRAERESAEITSRETRFTSGSDERIGQVNKHIAAPDRDEVRSESEQAEGVNPLDRTSLRDAVILSEILGPPLALRDRC